MQRGFTNADAIAAAPGVVYRQIIGQRLLLALMDCFRVMGWIALAMIPVVLVIPKFCV